MKNKMKIEEKFKWKDKWNKTKGEILAFLGHSYAINVKLAKGSGDSLRLEKKWRRIEISNDLSKTVLKEWCFYNAGGWKTTGYEEFFGITQKEDAIKTALQIFAAQSVSCDSFLVEYLEASE